MGVVQACLWQYGRRAVDSGGSGCNALRLLPEPGMPTPEHLLPFPVEHPRTDLQQQMSAALGPLHLLFLGRPLAHHLVNRRFDKARADSLAIAVALSVVRYAALIAFDVGPKLLHRLEQL